MEPHQVLPKGNRLVSLDIDSGQLVLEGTFHVDSCKLPQHIGCIAHLDGVSTSLELEVVGIFAHPPLTTIHFYLLQMARSHI